MQTQPQCRQGVVRTAEGHSLNLVILHQPHRHHTGGAAKWTFVPCRRDRAERNTACRAVIPAAARGHAGAHCWACEKGSCAVSRAEVNGQPSAANSARIASGSGDRHRTNCPLPVPRTHSEINRENRFLSHGHLTTVLALQAQLVLTATPPPLADSKH